MQETSGLKDMRWRYIQCSMYCVGNRTDEWTRWCGAKVLKTGRRRVDFELQYRFFPLIKSHGQRYFHRYTCASLFQILRLHHKQSIVQLNSSRRKSKPPRNWFLLPFPGFSSEIVWRWEPTMPTLMKRKTALVAHRHGTCVVIVVADMVGIL